MNNSAHTLEFQSFLDLLASYTSSDPVKRKIRNIKPEDKLEKITNNHELIKVLLQLLELNMTLPVAEIDDLHRTFKKIKVEGYIAGVRELLNIKKFLDSIKEISGALQRIEHGPIQLTNRSLSQLRERFNFMKDLNDAISFTLDHPDLIKNSASPALQETRREILSLETSLRNRIEGIMRGLEKDEMLQDSFYTVRKGRFVVPVKVELKKKVPGIIHDYSDTEKTAFVEPAPLIDAGNQLASLKAAEKAESRRILRNLTEKVKARLPELKANNDAIVYYEFLRATAEWGHDFNCCVPSFGKKFKLVKARHPLMEKQFRDEKRLKDQIPLEFELNPNEHNTVAITGSNAGGKTVVLKTVGLLALIAQCGLPVPCEEESSFICFQNILADIGDSQSIVHNLSTFSAHLDKVKKFFNVLERQHRRNNLILIDEIGSGTDPLEGGSLACAILQKMSQLATITIATTHLGTVKTFVSATDKMINAAMLFNTKTFEPEFRLHIGRPGASHALNLARKMDLPQDVLRHAETILDSDHLRLESMLANLEEDQRKFYQDAEQLRIDREETAVAKASVKGQLEQLRKERKKIMHEAYREASVMTQRTHKEMQKIIKQLSDTATAEAAEAAEESRRKLQEKQQKLQKGMKATEAKPSAPVRIEQLQPGMKVWVEKLQARALVTSVNTSNKKVKIDLDGLPFEVPLKQIGRIVDEKQQPETPKRGPLKTSRPRAEAASCEINVVGLRVHQALNKLERDIDQAMLANIDEIRIIHGYGTGTLRNAIHEYLNRLNLSYREGEQDKGEGGAGSTIVTL